MWPQTPQMGAAQQPQQPAQGLDPALVQQVMALNQLPQKQAAIDRQRKLADVMRNDAAGQMQGRSAGGIYRAPGALNLVANVMAQRKAQGLNSTADTAQTALGNESTGAMQRYFDALIRQNRPAPNEWPTAAGG